MTRSLTEDLRALAHTGPADPGAAIADRAGHMVRTIRRRRAVRQAGMGVVGVSTAAVLAFAVGSTSWLSGSTSAGASDVEPGPDGNVPDATDEPTLGPTLEPTEPTPEPTADATAEPAADVTQTPPDAATGDVLTPGLALIAEDTDLTIACGAPLNAQILSDAGGLGADHLTPGTRTDPTRADQPVTVYNAIPGDGEPLNGTSWTTPAAIVTRDDVIVGWGGAEVVFDSWQPVVQEYTIELPALHQCATPAMSPDGLGVYTIWVIALEGGFGLPAGGEGLSWAAGMEYDVATGAFTYVVD